MAKHGIKTCWSCGPSAWQARTASLSLISHLLPKFGQSVRLLRGGAVQKVASESSMGACIQIGQTGEKSCALCLVVPLGQNQVDEVVDADCGCSGRLRRGSERLRRRLSVRGMISSAIAFAVAY